MPDQGPEPGEATGSTYFITLSISIRATLEMERRVVDFLEKLVHGISSIFVFGHNRAHEFDIPLLSQAESGLCQPAWSLDAQEQPTARDVQNSEMTTSDAQTQTTDQVQSESYSYRRPDVMANSDSGLAVVLTDSMVAQISTVLQATKQIELLEQSCTNASRVAKSGRDFLNHASFVVTDGNIDEERAHYARSLQEREPAILQDIQHESDLKDQLQSWTLSRDFLRASLENSLAHMFHANQLDEAPEIEQPEVMPELGVDVYMHDTISERTVSVDSANDIFLADPTAKNLEQASAQYDDAVNRMRELQELSDRREQGNEEDMMRYREALRDGEVDFPESELRELHREQERELTLNLIEADLVLERALANAKMWGLVMDDDDESDFRNRESCNHYDSGADVEDLPSPRTIGDHARIEAWVEMVSESPDEISSIPEIDEWDTRSVDISSTVSMRDTSNRIRIDRWRSYCASCPLPTEQREQEDPPAATLVSEVSSGL